MKNINLLKAAATGLLLCYGAFCAVKADEGTFLDRVDLVIHEAGHVIFGFIGETAGILGGTIMQLAVPAALSIYFRKRGEMFSAAFGIFWIGQNLFNISVYIKDAAAMELPLINVGGGEGIHDWNYLLLKINLLAWDQLIGSICYGLGLVLVTLSILPAARSCLREDQR